MTTAVGKQACGRKDYRQEGQWQVREEPELCLAGGLPARGLLANAFLPQAVIELRSKSAADYWPTQRPIVSSTAAASDASVRT